MDLESSCFGGEVTAAQPEGDVDQRNERGHFDERAGAFDAEVERAVRASDFTALLALDPALARELMATGRPAWQVLAGALEGRAGLATEVQYADDPFGVAYLVATIRPSASREAARRG